MITVDVQGEWGAGRAGVEAEAGGEGGGGGGHCEW